MASLDERVLKVIELVRENEISRGRDPIKVFTEGNCGNLYNILKTAFKCAQPVGIDSYEYSTSVKNGLSHVITKIGNNYYDITGRVKRNKYDGSNPLILEESLKDYASNMYGHLDENQNKKREMIFMDQTMKCVKEFVKSDEFIH